MNTTTARLTPALDAALSAAAINCGMRQTARNVLYRLSANHIDAAEATALLAPGALAEYDRLRREAMRTEAACEAQRASLAYLNHAGNL